jgi:hypothetical protein
MTVVGQSTESATVGVTRGGSLVYAPVNRNSSAPPANLVGPELVVRSRDLGASWSDLDSGFPPHGSGVPPWMHVDPATSRIWFATALASLCGAEVSWSDDGGEHWQTNQAVGCPGMGSMRLLEGPAPPGGAHPSGYPHVVYYCGNATDFGPSNLWCFKSLDGGHSFAFVGSVPDPTPPPYSCGTNHPARPGVVGPDGFLYFPLDTCGKLGIAVSRDEGATWERLPVRDTNVQDLYITAVATDSAGNVYLAWVAGPGQPTGGDGCCGLSGLPYLSVSRDHGHSWSKPLMIAPPGVRKVLHSALAADGSGHVAVSYLGTRDGKSYDGYITESSDALSRRPTFWSAPVNDPARPLVSASRSETFGDRLFFFSDAIGPGGVPWAAFHCAYTSACPGRRLGVVGRLAPAGAAGGGCLDPPRRVQGSQLGAARLGRDRKRQRAILGGRLLGRRGGIDRYCLAGGGAMRIGYPTRRLRRRGGALLILTSSGRLSIRGLRVGSRVRGLRGARTVRVGRNTWYLASGARSRLLFQVRRGRVRQLGIADKRLTARRRASVRFLRGWQL